ncbi:extracellular solute-binding protein [Paracoccus liaowanqingii]|uniref:Extracellular solute-binding protein n=1 Tax=Paracoccus liaowanqingii TaxID=2560053 RepID=A0A4P7HL67_9RHOB|nr:extracellular solute-binding protein [Paracoccus liaowanqingii]QBX34958.1 extracellular solute-binding protein [Paracoccus liaowanqingii]
MNRILAGLAALTATPALAEGELHIFNWGNYTPPELIEKFQDTYDVLVTVTEYDSNDAALAKIRAGGHGFDIVVPTSSFLPIWIAQDLLLQTNPGQMENAGNILPEWADPEWDPGRVYTAPWQWGTTGILVHTGSYAGDINTSAIFLDPPEELRGRINVVPEMQDIMNLAVMYYGGEICSADMDILRQVRDGMLAAKPFWTGIDYPPFETLINEDILASTFWNGASGRIRAANPDFAYGYPREGFPIWMENVAVLADARNPDNAKLFQNFVMDPENAAIISNYLRYANAIAGSEDFMDPDLIDAPELVIPEDLQASAQTARLCEPATQDIYTRIWTEVLR